MNNIIELNKNEINAVTGGSLWNWVSHAGVGIYILGGIAFVALGGFFTFAYFTKMEDFEADSMVEGSALIFVGIGAICDGVEHFINLGSAISVPKSQE